MIGTLNELTLMASVDGIRAGSRFTDGKARARLRVEGCDAVCQYLEFPIDFVDDFPLERRFEVIIRPVEVRVLD